MKYLFILLFLMSCGGGGGSGSSNAGNVIPDGDSPPDNHNFELTGTVDQ